MSNLEREPQEVLCESTVDSSGVEILEPREVPLGGPRALLVHRTLPQRARSLIGALQQVPAVDEEANEPWGIIPGYAVAAKTGTSQEWDATRKCLCKYGASYIGMAPGNNPQVVVAVNVQNPKKGGYFGDVVAGPVFYKVMTFALQTLKIPPPWAQPADVPLTGP